MRCFNRLLFMGLLIGSQIVSADEWLHPIFLPGDTLVYHGDLSDPKHTVHDGAHPGASPDFRDGYAYVHAKVKNRNNFPVRFSIGNPKVEFKLTFDSLDVLQNITPAMKPSAYQKPQLGWKTIRYSVFDEESDAWIAKEKVFLGFKHGFLHLPFHGYMGEILFHDTRPWERWLTGFVPWKTGDSACDLHFDSAISERTIRLQEAKIIGAKFFHISDDQKEVGGEIGEREGYITVAPQETLLIRWFAKPDNLSNGLSVLPDGQLPRNQQCQTLLSPDFYSAFEGKLPFYFLDMCGKKHIKLENGKAQDATVLYSLSTIDIHPYGSVDFVSRNEDGTYQQSVVPVEGAEGRIVDR